VRQIEGAYSLVADQQEADRRRDPLGIRPLVLGELDGADPASETCALDIIGAEVRARHRARRSRRHRREGHREPSSRSSKQKRASASSNMSISPVPIPSSSGRNVYDTASAWAPSSPAKAHVEADVIVPVPDSGVPAAIGYLPASAAFPFELGIIRNHYVGRTFIEPTEIRHSACAEAQRQPRA
jgi:amidophosphoribosyltransferase